MRLLALVLAVGLAFIFPGASAAQDGESLVVGASEVAWTSDWELLGSLDNIAAFQHRTIPFTYFDYSELTDGEVPLPDNETLIEVETIRFYEGWEPVSELQLVGSGTLPDQTLWQLYALRLDGAPLMLLVTGNTDILPGVDVISTMPTPEAELIAAHFAVEDGFTIDSDPVPVARVDPRKILEAAIAWLGGEDRAADRPRIPLPNPAL